MLEDREGNLWFGTADGISRYDGFVFQDLLRRDGLVHRDVRRMHQDRNGDVWITTAGGITRYRSHRTSPAVRIENVVADRRYEPEEEVRLPSSHRFIVFEFQGQSFSTRPDQMVYVYRLQGYEEEWQQTREGRVEYLDLPTGAYTFQVKAVDRDLNYSEEPAEVRVMVHLPYEKMALMGGLGMALVGLVLASGYGIKRRRERDRVREELVREQQERIEVQQQLVEKLEQANRQIQETTRHKSDFLSRMSHDLRTPMNAIIGYTRILLRKARERLDKRQFRNLENIHTSADNLLGLINEILDLSRIEAGRIDITPEEVDLNQLFGDCITSVEPLVKQEVQLRPQLEDVPAVRTDGNCLRRVVMNLLGNAVKFTEEGSITVSLRPAGEWRELTVADTGVGIPSEDLPHIFEEFRQVERQVGEKREGTGLGLAIAAKSVEMLGGTISAESEVGKGTTFTLKIKDY